MVDFLFVIIELFHCLLRLRCYKWNSVEVGVFRRGWVTWLERKFQTEGGIGHQTLLVSENECIKISAVHCLVLSQSTRDGQTDGQNYDSQDRANIAASHGKNYFRIIISAFVDFRLK